MHSRSDSTDSKGLKRRVAQLIAFTVLNACLASMTVEAASVSYPLDQSSRLTDGIGYLQLTIDDGGQAGAIRFTLQTLSPLSDVACKNFGIQKLGFNGIDLDQSNIVGLPDGWKLRHDKKMDGFGKFENVLVGKKWNGQDPLTFSIVGIDGDSLATYTTSHDGDDGLFFAAFVAGLEGDKRGKGHDEDCRRCLKGAYFAGSAPTPVPLPAAAWLFGSGLLGLLGMVRRKTLA